MPLGDVNANRSGAAGTDLDDATPTYYGDDWLSEGASDVEELDTASVEVSVDEDDLVAREAEVVAGRR